MSGNSPRRQEILVIEDRPAVQTWLVEAAVQAFERANVRCVETLDAAQAHAREAAPDLVLIDIAFSEHGEEDALVWSRRQFPRAAIVVICDDDDLASMTAALKAGAVGCLLRSLQVPVVVAALRLIQTGCPFMPPQLLSHVQVSADEELTNRSFELTERQRELLRLVLKGHDNAKIAQELGISVGTVKQHLNAIFRAIGVSSRTELLALAVRGGIRRDGSSVSEAARSPITGVV